MENIQIYNKLYTLDALYINILIETKQKKDSDAKFIDYNVKIHLIKDAFKSTYDNTETLKDMLVKRCT